MSGDPEQEYFADGMVEDIIAALSRFNELFVIARIRTSSTRARHGYSQVARELGVRYVSKAASGRPGTAFASPAS